MSTPSIARPRRMLGVTLVELIIFIVIVSTAVVALLIVMNVSTRNSADPMLYKQAVDVAESLMEEIFLHPFTYCDPDDDNARAAGSTAQCSVVQSLGPTGTESRYSSTNPYDNVADYAGFSTGQGIRDMTGDGTAIVSGLENYSASVSISQVGTSFSLTADAVLKIVVTVTGNGVTVPLTAYRFRYAPNDVP